MTEKQEDKAINGNNIRWATFNLIMDTKTTDYPAIFGGEAIKLTATEMMVWIALFRHARQNGKRFEVTLSYSRLADFSKTSAATVKRTIGKLQKIKAIRVIKKGAIDGFSNVYEIKHFIK